MNDFFLKFEMCIFQNMALIMSINRPYYTVHKTFIHADLDQNICGMTEEFWVWV